MHMMRSVVATVALSGNQEEEPTVWGELHTRSPLGQSGGGTNCVG